MLPRTYRASHRRALPGRCAQAPPARRIGARALARPNSREHPCRLTKATEQRVRDPATQSRTGRVPVQNGGIVRNPARQLVTAGSEPEVWPAVRPGGASHSCVCGSMTRVRAVIGAAGGIGGDTAAAAPLASGITALGRSLRAAVLDRAAAVPVHAGLGLAPGPDAGSHRPLNRVHGVIDRVHGTPGLLHNLGSHRPLHRTPRMNRAAYTSRGQRPQIPQPQPSMPAGMLPIAHETVLPLATSAVTASAAWQRRAVRGYERASATRPGHECLFTASADCRPCRT